VGERLGCRGAPDCRARGTPAAVNSRRSAPPQSSREASRAASAATAHTAVPAPARGKMASPSWATGAGCARAASASRTGAHGPSAVQDSAAAVSIGLPTVISPRYSEIPAGRRSGTGAVTDGAGRMQLPGCGAAVRSRSRFVRTPAGVFLAGAAAGRRGRRSARTRISSRPAPLGTEVRRLVPCCYRTHGGTRAADPGRVGAGADGSILPAACRSRRGLRSLREAAIGPLHPDSTLSLAEVIVLGRTASSAGRCVSKVDVTMAGDPAVPRRDHGCRPDTDGSSAVLDGARAVGSVLLADASAGAACARAQDGLAILPLPRRDRRMRGRRRGGPAGLAAGLRRADRRLLTGGGVAPSSAVRAPRHP